MHHGPGRNTTIADLEGLIRAVRDQYVLGWYGIHGWDHWMKIHSNGMLIAEENGREPA